MAQWDDGFWGWPTVKLNYIAEPHGYSVDASRCSRVTNSDPSYPKFLHMCHYEYIRTWYDYIIDRIPETKIGRNCRKRPTRSLHSSWRGRMQRGWSCPSLWGTLKSHGFRFQVKHPPPTWSNQNPPKNHPFPLGSPVSLRHAERRSPTSKRKPTTGNWMPSWRRRLRPSKERRWRWKPTQRWQRCSPRTWTVSGSSKSAGSSSQRGHDALHPTDKKYWTRAFRWVSYIFLGGWDYSSHPPKKSAWWQLDLCRARNMVCLAIKSGWICIYPLVGESLVMVGGAYPMYHVLTGMFGFVWTRERLIPLVQHHKNITILSLTSPFFGASIHKRNWTVKHQKCSIRWDDQLNKPAKWRIASLCIQVGISRRNLQLAHEKHAFPNPKSEKSSILLRWQRKRSRMPWRRHFMGRSRGWDMLGDDSWMNFGKWNGFGTLYFGAKDLDPLVDFGTLVATSSGHFTCHNLVTPYFQIRRNKLSRRPTSRRRLLQPWRRPIGDLKPPRLI